MISLFAALLAAAPLWDRTFQVERPAEVTAAVSARIRWQGVRLYLRGLPVIPRPAHQSQEGVQ